MNDELDDFFKNIDFDIDEPNEGHEIRFLNKLEQTNSKKKKTSWKWMSIAASFVLMIGFYLGNNYQNKNNGLASISPKVAEAESFFVTTINQELKEIEKFRTIETESIIEDALDQIEDLEDNFKTLKDEIIEKNGNELHSIQNMIFNYQKRLEILEKLLIQLNSLNNPDTFNTNYNEII